MNDSGSSRYQSLSGEAYFAYQNQAGLHQGRIESRKFARFVDLQDTVLDFGCGSGAVLASLRCARRIGVEVNEAAHESCRGYGIEVHKTLITIPDDSATLAISNHALEHVLCPLNTLKDIRKKLLPGSALYLCLPIDDWRTQKQMVKDDINHHLYTWTPKLIANLLHEAGYKVLEVQVMTHAWPPMWQQLDQVLPVRIFDIVCTLYSAYVKRRQLFVIASKEG